MGRSLWRHFPRSTTCPGRIRNCRPTRVTSTPRSSILGKHGKLRARHATFTQIPFEVDEETSSRDSAGVTEQDTVLRIVRPSPERVLRGSNGTRSFSPSPPEGELARLQRHRRLDASRTLTSSRLSRLPSLSKRRRACCAWAVQATTSGGSDPTRNDLDKPPDPRGVVVYVPRVQASTLASQQPHRRDIAGTTFSEAMPGSRLGPAFDQDLSNLAGMQRGLHSKFYPGTMHALYQESLIRHFEETLDPLRLLEALTRSLT